MLKLSKDFKKLLESKEVNKSKKVIEFINKEPELIDYIFPGSSSGLLLICMHVPHLVPYFVKYYNADINQRLIKGPILGLMCTDPDYANICITLIKLGANVNMAGVSGKTALMACALRDNVKVLKTLIDYGAKIEKMDDNNTTALSFACGYMSLNCVKELIKAGANVNHKNDSGHTPLTITLYSRNQDAHINTEEYETRRLLIVKELLKAGADIFVVANNKKTIFDYLDDKPQIKHMILQYIEGVKKVLGHKQMKLPEHVINKKIMSYLVFGRKKSKKSKKKSRSRSRSK